MAERGGGHDRYPWEGSDDWFASPEPARQGSGDVEENWLEEEAATEVPRRPGLLSRLHRGKVAVAAGALVGALLLLVLWLTGAFGGAGTAPRPATSTRPPAATTVRAPVPAPVLPPSTTLTPGSRGPQVKRLQRALARLGYPTGSVDGRYGPATMEALKRFQQADGLHPDGVLGPQTLQALRSKLAASGR
jgi:hypothetical protein